MLTTDGRAGDCTTHASQRLKLSSTKNLIFLIGEKKIVNL
jgi:hypothetical protein